MALARRKFPGIIKVIAVVVSAVALPFVVVGGIVGGYVYYAMAEFQDTEILRVSNPGASMDAVIVQRSGSAATPFGDLIFVLPKGEKIYTEPTIFHRGEPVLNGAYTDGLVVTWRDDTTLAVHADNSRVYDVLCDVTVKLKSGPRVVKITWDIPRVGIPPNLKDVGDRGLDKYCLSLNQ